MQLRPYQTAAVNAVEHEWASGRQKTLLVMPTGSGKTIVFAKLAENLVRDGRKVLILAHRGELLQQAADKLAAATGLGCSVEKAQFTGEGEWFQVTVGSVQTLMRPKRLEKFKRDHFGAIIVDEAHHTAANSYLRILNYFTDTNVLGVTATPDRTDKQELGQIYDSLAFEYTLREAIREGYLCKIKALSIPLSIDLSSVAIQAGDFKAADIGTALDPYLHSIADEMVTHCAGRKTLVFLPLIATSQKFAAILSEKGMRVAEVNGMSDNRAEILTNFERGEYDALCNSMLLTEGYDCPSIDCIVCLRPTKSRSLYAQICGRGTRIHPGKDHLLLLDFLWLSERHELCRPAHLVAKDEELARAMTRALIESSGCPEDLEQLEIVGESNVVREREERLAKQLEEMRRKKRKQVDPLQFEVSIAAEDLMNYAPSFAWEMAPPSKAQLDALDKAGIYAEAIDNAGKASLLLNRIAMRRSAGLTTPKQIRCLENYGFTHVGEWSFDGARRVIDRIAANGWRLPSSINPHNYKPYVPDLAEEDMAWTG